MTYASDMAYCEEAIRHGSLSFHAASKILPRKVREPALALYAFCRLADDAVDLQAEKAAAVLSLKERLEMAYAGTPRDTPTDRAFTRMIEDFEMPRALPEALLEGLAWDAMGRRYETLSGVYDYSARVASAVGAMMCVLMRVRDADALARACDLGVAMQLTNMARDVGEDALEGRCYLPLDWFDEAGLDVEAFLANPKPTKAIRQMVRKFVTQADRLYMRSEAGIAALPLRARPGIFAARHIYAGISGRVQAAGYDSISSRARTSKLQKLGWLGQSIVQAGTVSVMPRSAVIYAPALDEVQFLVDAASTRGEQSGWGDTLMDAFATLKAHDENQRGIQT